MVFETLLINVIPLYGLIALGFIIGKTTDLDVKPIATLMLYALLPVVMFGATATMEFTSEYFVPPLIIASISIIASTTGYLISRKVWGEADKRHNLLGMLGVSSNATYFGVPIALALMGKDWLSVYMMMVFSLFVLDCTLGYYFAVRGESSMKDSLIRVTKLPILYGAILGAMINLAGIELSPLALEYWDRFTGTMIILGMMIIGSGLAQMDRFRFDRSFFVAVLMLRFILWPVLGLIWVALDLYYFQILPDTIHALVILITACPLAANTVAYAVKINLHPALTSCMVLITTFLALAFIPFMMWLKTIIF